MPRNKYTRELLEPIVKECKSWAEVCRRLGIASATGAQSHLTRQANKLAVDHSHFTGRGWNKGKVFEKKNLSVHLIKNSTYHSSHRLKLWLINNKLKKAECEICNLTKWRDEDIVLELDHINSDHFDNRLENLQILCPNCHAAKTRKRKADVVERKTRGA